MKPEIGLALAGGGVPGACVHAGFVDALREHYNIIEISGASAGAIVASVYAANPDACLRDMLIDKLADRTIVKRRSSYIAIAEQMSLYEHHYLRDILDDAIGKVPLKVPLRVVTSNLDERASNTFLFEGNVNRHLVTKAVLASAAVPGLLKPVTFGDEWHVDGGLCKNLPLDVLSAERRLGAYFPDDAPRQKGLLGYVEALISTVVNGNVADEIRECNWPVVKLKKVGALLPERISTEDAKHLCLTGYRIGKDYVHRRS